MTERYKAVGQPVNDYERELLTILMEECAEVIQAASKLIRFGRENNPDTGQPNARELGLELGDLSEVQLRLGFAGTIKHMDIFDGLIRKRKRLDQYLQTDPPKS